MNQKSSSTLVFEKSRLRYERALLTVPGGVHSNVRLSEQPHPLFFESGAFGHLLDVDGNDIIDWVCGNGPLLLGHSPVAVLEAVKHQLDRGLLYAAQSDLELEAAERLSALVPSAERVRFSMTGTEAVQAALRIARAATGRTKILRFSGHYHGWADSVLYNVGTASQPCSGSPDTFEPIPESLGSDRALASSIVVAQWNDLGALARILASHGSELAAVLMEPVMGNNGVIPPLEGYLDDVRALTTENGVLLIFDEVITGFRVACGGAQVRYGVTPDISVFGKAIASGFPVAAVVGRADLFEAVGVGRVTHAGTFNSNQVGMAATVATLRILGDQTSGVYERLETAGARLRDGLAKAICDTGTPAIVQGLPALFSIAFTHVREIRNHLESAQSNRTALARFCLETITRGVRVMARGNFFFSAVHTDQDIDRTLNVCHDALRAMQSAP